LAGFEIDECSDDITCCVGEYEHAGFGVAARLAVRLRPLVVDVNDARPMNRLIGDVEDELVAVDDT
jgi:hypothetical protein